jgi:heat-inducible transcriptional repressor
MARRKDRPSGPLEPRSQDILRAVIEEYIAAATPVGSHALVERRGLNVSPATVRNVMADLEAAGYLSHPHTSAGRVPTEAGYRLYVETIAPDASLGPVARLMIRHQFGQVEFASEQWFRLAAATLAGTTHNAGIATPAKPSSARMRRIDLVATAPHTASLVVVLAEGSVKQVIVPLLEEHDQASLDTIARLLNEELASATATQVAATARALRERPEVPRLAIIVAERIERLMREFDAAAVEDVFSDGLLNVMAAPEFSQSGKLRRVFGVLQNLDYMAELMGRVADSDEVHVLIGSDNRHAEMLDVSLVLASYGRPGRAIGVVGVLGPTRMAYPQAIGSVRYVSGLMNELVEQLYR